MGSQSNLHGDSLGSDRSCLRKYSGTCLRSIHNVNPGPPSYVTNRYNHREAEGERDGKEKERYKRGKRKVERENMDIYILH